MSICDQYLCLRHQIQRQVMGKLHWTDSAVKTTWNRIVIVHWRTYATKGSSDQRQHDHVFMHAVGAYMKDNPTESLDPSIGKDTIIKVQMTPSCQA